MAFGEAVSACVSVDLARVSASVQTAYVEALRAAGVVVDHRFLPAAGALRHDLQTAGVIAAFTFLQTRNPS